MASRLQVSPFTNPGLPPPDLTTQLTVGVPAAEKALFNEIAKGFMPSLLSQTVVASGGGGTALCSAFTKNTQIPIGNMAQSVSNFHGNKFTNGWLSGANDSIEFGLGCLAQTVRPTPYNSQEQSRWRGAGPMAPVPGLAMVDVNVPGRSFNGINHYSAERIPTTWDVKGPNGFYDVISGARGPMLYGAKDGITGAPKLQPFAWAQLRDVDPAVAPPSYSFPTPLPSYKKNKTGGKGANLRMAP